MMDDLAAPVVAIDGPSASGKGTVAARVAQALGLHYLDSGALYRLVALAASRAGVSWDDQEGCAAIARSLPARFSLHRVFLGADDVTEAIREEHISAGASRVASLAAVRSALEVLQRDFRRPPGLVAEGRDMGSVIFPGAALKVFLTASVDARAQRRYKQLIDKGLSANISTLSQDLRERDARDASRAAAPLRKCDDAVLLDTTDLTIDQAVEFVVDLARQRMGQFRADEGEGARRGGRVSQ